MSSLDVFDADGYGEAYYIAWIFDGDEGGILGDETYTDVDLAKAAAKSDDDSWQHIKATITASKTERVDRRRVHRAMSTCYVWPTRKAATAALRAVKAAIKDRSDVPWPDWAVKAKAAGWTPPKGWAP